MSCETHRIYGAAHDLLVYDEGEERRIEFSCPANLEPPQVSLPARQHWAAHLPDRARARRTLQPQDNMVPASAPASAAGTSQAASRRICACASTNAVPGCEAASASSARLAGAIA